jgi:hypothetical protein
MKTELLSKQPRPLLLWVGRGSLKCSYCMTPLGQTSAGRMPLRLSRYLFKALTMRHHLLRQALLIRSSTWHLAML